MHGIIFIHMSCVCTYIFKCLFLIYISDHPHSTIIIPIYDIKKHQQSVHNGEQHWLPAPAPGLRDCEGRRTEDTAEEVRSGYPVAL